MRQLGATSHGLRHEMLNDLYQDETGQASPVRGGGPVPPEIDKAARLTVAKAAGHSRTRAAGAYLGAVLGKRALPRDCPGQDDADPVPA